MPACQAGGRRFESVRPLHTFLNRRMLVRTFVFNFPKQIVIFLLLALLSSITLSLPGAFAEPEALAEPPATSTEQEKVAGEVPLESEPEAINGTDDEEEEEEDEIELPLVPSEAVEPLEVWEKAPEPPKAPRPRTPKIAVEDRPERVEPRKDSLFEEYLEEEEEGAPVAIRTTKSEDKPLIEVRAKRLSATQRSRMRAAQMRERHEALRYRRAQKQRLARDPRGAAELRACSVNLNNYGLSVEIKRILRRELASTLRLKENSVVSAIVTVGCDVVALQGIVGHDYGGALEGLERLRKLVARKSGREWQAFLGQSNHKFAREAFIVARDERITIGGTRSYTDTLLPRFEQFQLEKFHRGPMELMLTVRGHESAPAKAVSLFNFYFQNALRPAKVEPETERMQMAEAVRQVLVYRRTDYPVDQEPIFVLLGDRVSRFHAPSSEILEGSLELTDFKTTAGCRVVEKTPENPKNPVIDWGYECEKGARSGKTLVGLFHGTLEPSPQVIEKRAGDVVKRFYRRAKPRNQKRKIDKRTQTAEIYLFEDDLESVRANPYSIGVYKVKALPVQNDLPQSPLLWVELNW